MKPARKYTSTVESRLIALEARILALEIENEDLLIKVADLEDEVFETVPDKPLPPDVFAASFQYVTDMFNAFSAGTPKSKEN